MAQPPLPTPTTIPNVPPSPRPPSTASTAPSQPRTTVAPGAGALEGESLHAFITRLDNRAQQFLDRIAPFKLYRWLTLIAMLAIFMIRMILLEGFYVVTYILFIYILNQFILFLQPKDRASLVARASAAASPTADDDTADNPTPLPTMDDEEFRPFVRRLPEFKFWYSTTYATFLAFCATFWSAFDVPVFWPVLLFYFVVLFVTTMRKQWLDMKKLKYVPWDIGSKKVYKSDPKRLAVTKPGPVDVVAASGRGATNPPPVPTVNVVTKKPPQSSSGSIPATPQVARPAVPPPN